MKRIHTPRPKLDVRDLEVVLAVAAAGSTAKAASTLHVTQSAVSRGLLLAEEKLGVRLFERTGRGLAPTPAGERLVAGAGGVLAQLVDLESQAAGPLAAPVRVRIVCECYTAYRWLPSTLAKLKGGMTALDVALAVDHTADPVEALLAREVDIALLTTAPVRGGLLELPLFSDEIVFVLAPSHPLARRPTIGPRDLRATTLITSSSTPEAERRWFASQVFGRARPKLDVVQFPLTEAIMDAARAGMGVAVVSEWIANAYLSGGDLVAKRFAGGALGRPWRMAFRPEARAIAERLAAALEGSPPRVYARRDRSEPGKHFALRT